MISKNKIDKVFSFFKLSKESLKISDEGRVAIIVPIFDETMEVYFQTQPIEINHLTKTEIIAEKYGQRITLL